LQQGLIELAFLRDMEAHNQRVTRFRQFTVHEGKTHPVEVELEKVVGDGGSNDVEVKMVKAKYLAKVILSALVSIGLSGHRCLSLLVGCDGRRSAVQLFLEKQHGFQMKGDWVDTLWGAIEHR